MIFIEHPSTTRWIGKPNSMPMEECAALPISDVVYPHGQRAMVSFWTFSEEEIAKILAGQPVQLHILSSQHPVVAIVVGDSLT